MRFSASMIKSYMDCSLKAKFEYIDQLPGQINAKTAYGSCIHKALEIYNKSGDIEKAKKLFKQYWDNPELVGSKIDYWPKYITYGGLRKKGLETLDVYHENCIWKDRDILGVEHKFCVPFGEHEISGIVDLLEYSKDNTGEYVLKITDYKSGKQPTQMELNLSVQFSLYIYASMQKEFWIGHPTETKYPQLLRGEESFEIYQDVTRRGIWYNLNNDKEVPVGKRDESDFTRLYRCLNEIEKAINKDVFIPDISGQSCNYCSHKDHCFVTIPILDKLTEEAELL